MIETILNVLMIIIVACMFISLLGISLMSFKMDQIIKWSKENARSTNKSH